jgi:hypothetical protein
LSRSGAKAGEEIYQQADSIHPYNSYITALEQMRSALETPELPFYLDLLQTPLKERAAHILEQGNRRHGTFHADFTRTFSAANAALKESGRL